MQGPVVCAPILHLAADEEEEDEEEDEEEEEASTAAAADSVTDRRRGTLIKKRFDVLRPYVGCAEISSARR